MSAIDWSRKRTDCPSCGAGRGAFSITPKDGDNAIGRCFRCGFMTWRDAEEPAFVRTDRPAPQQAPKHETLSDYGRELWGACRPIEGAARAYLEARRCVIPPADGALRFHPALKHPPSGMLAPALVALCTDAVTGEPLTLHRTWIESTGKKAPLERPRMLLGGHRKAGAVIRLWGDDYVTTGLAIGEGIETCLSLAHAVTPVWSCIDAGNLTTFPVLPGIESLLIAADHDDAGIKAAKTCADRWAEAGREVRIAMPPAAKTDINDLAVAA